MAGAIGFEEVEARLIEAMQFWWRVEGGRWPFAGDGPWHLIRRGNDAADAAELVLNAEREGKAATPAPKPVPLSLEEIARRDEATEWYLIVPERDRQLVQIAIGFLARGEKRVPWTRVRKKVRVENGTRALGQRYSRAITAICRALSGKGMRKAA